MRDVRGLPRELRIIDCIVDSGGIGARCLLDHLAPLELAGARFLQSQLVLLGACSGTRPHPRALDRQLPRSETSDSPGSSALSHGRI